MHSEPVHELLHGWLSSLYLIQKDVGHFAAKRLCVGNTYLLLEGYSV
jgi:hypothetical protein